MAGTGLDGRIALLVAGALALHVFMLSQGHASAGPPVAVAVGGPEAPAGHGHGAEGDDHSPAAMAAFCFSVLIGTAIMTVADAPGGSSIGRRRRARPVSVRDGPAWVVSVDVGVLLRV